MSLHVAAVAAGVANTKPKYPREASSEYNFTTVVFENYTEECVNSQTSLGLSKYKFVNTQHLKKCGTVIFTSLNIHMGTLKFLQVNSCLYYINFTEAFNTFLEINLYTHRVKRQS